MPQPIDQQFIALQEALAGTYSLETELGRGGMGIVYLARDVRLDRPVALKVLPQHLAANLEVRERFLSEARTAAKLSHPNIVPIFSVDEVGEFVFFAMAYIAGETLGQRVLRRGPLSATDATRILREVAWALSYAHSQGVIHRDIKPDNILLEDGSGRALVADFGIAGTMQESKALGIGEIVGTLEFMSPEQAEGRGVDARTDVYSLGMVGFHALSGELPFGQDTVNTTLEKVRALPVPALRSVTPTAPRRVSRVVDTCLQHDPDDRFQTADGLAEALDAVSATRKDIPVAVRTFLYDPVDLGGDGRTYFTVGALISAPFVLGVLADPDFVWPLLGYLAMFIGIPSLLVPTRVRQLLATGNTLPDLEIAIRQDLEDRREALPHSPPTRWSTMKPRIRKASWWGLGGTWLGYFALSALEVLGVGIGLPLSLEELASILGLVSAVGLAGTIVGSGSDKGEGQVRKAERRLRFWKGAIGRAIFKLSGLGLKKKTAPIGATHRPTEVQIGLAAEALFEALPKEVRQGLGDVPGVLHRLETDAQRLRESIERLSESGSPIHRLPADLMETRQRAEHHLSETVAALENVRLGLLRLSAGSGSVEGLTTNLAAAASIGTHVERIMEGLDEVEAALNPPSEPTA